MDEFDLTRRLLDGGEDDDAALERIRACLGTAIDAEKAVPGKTRGPRTRLLLGAVAASIAMLLALSLVLSLHPSSAIARTLEHLRAVAAAATAPSVRPGEFLLTRSEELRPVGRTMVGSSSSPTPSLQYTIIARLSIQTWIGADGSGARRESASSVRFASSADRLAWVAAGQPALAWSPGEVVFKTFGPGDAPWFDVGSLPTDPSALESALRAQHLEPGDTAPADDGLLFQAIGEILAQGDSPPDLRAALFEVASRIDGVQLVGGVVDPLGRAGTAIALDWNGERTQFVFNTDTSDLLAFETLPLGSSGLIGDQTYWRAFYPTTVTDSFPSH